MNVLYMSSPSSCLVCQVSSIITIVFLCLSGFKHHHEKALEQWRIEAAEAREAAVEGDDNSGTPQSPMNSACSQPDDATEALDAVETFLPDGEPPAPFSGTGSRAADDLNGCSSAVSGRSSAAAGGTPANEGENAEGGAGSSRSSNSDGSSGGASLDADLSDSSEEQFDNRARRHLDSRHAPPTIADSSRSSRRPPVQSRPEDVQKRVTAVRQVPHATSVTSFCS